MEARATATAITLLLVLGTLGGLEGAFAREAPDVLVPVAAGACGPQDVACGACVALTLTEECQPEGSPTAAACEALNLGPDCTPPDVCDALQQEPGCTQPDTAALCTALQLTDECAVPDDFDPSAALCAALKLDEGCTSPDVCESLAMDPDCLSPDASALPGQACDASGHEKTCAGVQDGAEHVSDPAHFLESDPQDVPGHVADDAQDAATEHVVGGACSDGNADACASANETAADPASVIPDIDLASTTGTLKILDPAPQAYNRSALKVTFSTDLPTSKAQDVVFVLASAAPGGTTWTYRGFTDCAGAGTRTCSITWDTHLLNEDVAIRVAYTNQTCTTATCVAVSPIHLDNTAPKSRALSVGSVPAGTVVVPVTATDNEGGKIALYGRTTGPWAKLAEGPNGTSVTWNGATPGNWSLQTVATDKAGNVESKLARVESRAAVAQFSAALVSPLYFSNGETPSVSVVVKQGGAAVGNALVTATYLGNPVALAYTGSGGVYGADLDGVVNVADVETHALSVAVQFSGNAVTLPATITYSPDRFVLLDVDSGGAGSTVPIGTKLLFTVTATYGDDGSPVDDLRITATGGPSDQEAYTSVGSGVAFFEWTSESAFTGTIAFSAADLGRANPTPVWSAPVNVPVVWTRLLVTSAPVPAAGFYNDVAANFARQYCVAFEGSNDPVSGAFVQLTIPRNNVVEIAAEGATAANGCITMTLLESVVGTYTYTPSVEWDSPEGATFLASGGSDVVVHFTKVVLTLAVSDAVVNETSATAFTVCGTYAHDSSKASGAHVDVATATDTLESALLLAANGCVTKSHAFSGLFNELVTARLVDTPEGVHADAQPAGTRVVATRITLAGGFDDTRVNVGDAPILAGTAKFAHDASNVAAGTFKVYRADDASKTSLAQGTITNGAFSVPVPYNALFAGDMAIDLLTATNDIDAQNAFTAAASWTEVHVALGAPSDTLVDTGDVVTLPVTATYADGVLASGAQIKARLGDATGAVLGTCTTNAQGACSLSVTSASVARGAVHVTSTNTSAGVALAVPATTAQTIRWTELVVTYTTGSGPFNTGSGANYQVTVTYADNGLPVENALVVASGFTVGAQSSYTDVDGKAAIAGIDTTAGMRTITLVAKQLDDGITKAQFAAGASKSLRWSAIAFHDYEYDPAPVDYDPDSGEPIWATGTTVNVCVVAVAKDTDEILSGATIYLRGVQKTTDANGRACVTVMKSNVQRNIVATAHGVSAAIGGKTITSSSDQSVRMHFVAP